MLRLCDGSAYSGREINDPTFGLLRLSRSPRGPLWLGRYDFRPTRSVIDIIVPTTLDARPPTPEQRDFIAEVEAGFGVVLAVALLPLKAAHAHYVPSPRVLRNMIDEFRLVGIEVPKTPESMVPQFEFSFRCLSDTSLTFTAMFRGKLYVAPTVRVRVDRD